MRLLEGGNYYHISSLEVPCETDELTAPAVAGPILSNSYWTDWQWNHDQLVNNPEVDLEPILFAGGQFTVDVWNTASQGPNNALVYTPYVFSIFVVDEVDSVGAGDPNDLIPTCIPNYFLLDYGRTDRSVTGPAPPPTPEESPWRRPTRTLFRTTRLADKGNVNTVGACNDVAVLGNIDMQFYGPAWKQRFSVRVKRHLLRRREAIYWSLSSFYTAVGVTANTMGIQIAGRFGYRRLVTSAR